LLLGFPSAAKLIAVLRLAALFLLPQGIQIPAPTGLVNDFAHVIQPDAAQRMERIAQDVRAKSRGEITIVTLPDIGTRDVQEVALEIGRQWTGRQDRESGRSDAERGCGDPPCAEGNEQGRTRSLLHRDWPWR